MMMVEGEGEGEVEEGGQVEGGVGKLVMVIGRILKHPSLFKNSSRNLV